MKIGITGYNGYIEKEIIKQLAKVHEIMKIGRKEDADIYLDLEDVSNFDGEVFKEIDYLIYTAAVSGPDMCAKEYERCWKINVESTAVVIGEALKHNCKVLFFSSDAVYGDITAKIYREKDVLQPDTAYGKMKCAVEQLFEKEKDFKALRLSYVASKKDKFISYCLKAIEEEKEIEVFHPFYRSCTTLKDVVDITEWCLNNWDEFPEKAINVCGTELVSRVRIVDEIGRILHKDVKYKIVKPEETFFENRPKITQTWSDVITKFSIIDNLTFTEKLINEFKMED